MKKATTFLTGQCKCNVANYCITNIRVFYTKIATFFHRNDNGDEKKIKIFHRQICARLFSQGLTH